MNWLGNWTTRKPQLGNWQGNFGISLVAGKIIGLSLITGKIIGLSLVAGKMIGVGLVAGEVR